MTTQDGQKLNPILRGTTPWASWIPSQVDRSKAIRTVPMKVLSLGYPRTGTMSTAAALYVLGYDDVYHMASLFGNPLDYDLWEKAILAKQGKGKFTKRDWDALLGHCMATTDWPCSAFPDELVAAYPEAKVILHVRPTAKWYASVKSTILCIVDLASVPILLRPFAFLIDFAVSRWGPIISRVTFIEKSCQQIVSNGSLDHEAFRDAYERHNAHVKAIVPPENLLLWGPQDGWEPLCKFLGRPVPEVPLPYINESESFKETVNALIVKDLVYLTKKASKWVGLTVGVIVAAKYLNVGGVMQAYYSNLKGVF